MLDYKAIEIFTSESARHQGRPLVETVIDYVRGLKIGARCIVTRGVAGCYENGETATSRIELLSFNMPIRIYIVVPAGQSDRVLDGLGNMVNDGIIALHGLKVISHRARNAFFPRQLMVRDVMTSNPRSVTPDTRLDDVTRLLLSSVFTGIPVINEDRQPIGVISQGDLIRKGGLPLRVGLLAESDRNRLDEVLTRMAAHRAAEVMTSPAVMIAENQPLSEAVELMLAKSVKRLPVTDSRGRLSGVLSRVDVFQTVMREAPDWNAFRAQDIDVTHLKQVADIIRRDTHTVAPDTPLEEVIRIIDDNDIQRVAVVDGSGKLLGLISDRDLLRFFRHEPTGIWQRLSRMARHIQQEVIGASDAVLANTTAGAVMTTDLTTAGEETLIEEAIGLMLDRGFKRLPVLDSKGRFKGMISRDSLLRAGFTAAAP
jgi:CBS domain-containing protein